MLILYISLFAIVCLTAFKLLIIWSAKRKRGLPVPTLPAEFADALSAERKSLYYFYNPSCSPCRIMNPVIEQIQSKYKNIYKVNVAQNKKVARDFGIRATPSMVLVENGIIRECFFGPQSFDKIEMLVN